MKLLQHMRFDSGTNLFLTSNTFFFFPCSAVFDVILLISTCIAPYRFLEMMISVQDMIEGRILRRQEWVEVVSTLVVGNSSSLFILKEAFLAVLEVVVAFLVVLDLIFDFSEARLIHSRKLSRAELFPSAGSVPI